ncbi:MAG TPA: MltA domain-containing protein [Candidatus Thiothrix moscowensis]|uniref:MltA domain-containing protein n=1 Tax=unclassified Thiothrix TaxID=2636184 RepID=UPI0025D833F1|nr:MULTISPECIES: MltA domain-containing protein [unclassified Thiothrix]HRJ51326.1 MltA domain-containing protein [Candidatus Thiothrix moscowensis]HRJ91619.1 MltA domain-containing protein [Candidatus Thiothrix moscowensis]
MLRPYLKGAALLCAVMVFPPAQANAPVWAAWGAVVPPQPYQQPYQQERRQFIPARSGNIQQVAYAAPRQQRGALDCAFAYVLDLPDDCISRNEHTRRGLLTQAEYLRKLPGGTKSAPLWGNVSNAALLETVQELLRWHDGISPGSLQERFSLREMGSAQRGDLAQFTGYFTPLLEVKSYPDSEFRIPIYREPPGSLARLSHAQIARNALGGKGLEVAWTNDPVNLFFAQVQGSGVARFPDGKELLLDYAGDNGQKFTSIADYMRMKGYKPRNFGNEGIREWLRQHPGKIGEVLTSNPRYVFFKLTDDLPTTASGTRVIPGHTVAVDHKYIPLGSVLLAEVPRVDSWGNKVGHDWRLLFAQDKGADIKGAGRLDLYTGFGRRAEELAHDITGFSKTWLLVRKPGYGRGSSVAGL